MYVDSFSSSAGAFPFGKIRERWVETGLGAGRLLWAWGGGGEGGVYRIEGLGFRVGDPMRVEGLGPRDERV